MATIKTVLRKSYQKKDGSFPIALRITKNRKSKFVFTGEYILEKDWDDTRGLASRSHPNSVRLNSFLLKKLNEAYDAALSSETLNEHQSVSAIKKNIVGVDKYDFFQASEAFLHEILKRKKFDQHYNQKKRLEVFKTFLGRKELAFPDLTPNHGNFEYAYAITSYSSQGKTVDRVLIAQPATTFLASNQKQFYVSVSRGREDVKIFTDDKQELLGAIQSQGDRQGATELKAISLNKTIVPEIEPVLKKEIETPKTIDIDYEPEL